MAEWLDMEEDPFDAVQNLEVQYYNEGYVGGLADGAKAGHLEGRFFGLEKGFEKFLEMGKLRGRSIVWSSRLPPTPGNPGPSESTTQDTPQSAVHFRDGKLGSISSRLKCEEKENNVSLSLTFPPAIRLERHLQTLHALSEPESLDTRNHEDAVADFDDRLRRAKAKARIIEKVIGEEYTSTRLHPSGTNVDGSNIEDVDIRSARH